MPSGIPLTADANDCQLTTTVLHVLFQISVMVSSINLPGLPSKAAGTEDVNEGGWVLPMGEGKRSRAPQCSILRLAASQRDRRSGQLGQAAACCIVFATSPWCGAVNCPSNCWPWPRARLRAGLFRAVNGVAQIFFRGTGPGQISEGAILRGVPAWPPKFGGWGLAKSGCLQL